MHQVSDYDYYLPETLIATHPLDRRDASRLMVLRPSQGTWEHRRFYELPTILDIDRDTLILNDSRVIPAYLESADGAVNFLLTRSLAPDQWLCLANPGKKARVGASFFFPRRSGGTISATVKAIEEGGQRLLVFEEPFSIEDIGDTPLPPYIIERRAALKLQLREMEDRHRYQTLYATREGSIAAPTAGLHFTPELLKTFHHITLTLHVGIGTFRPVNTIKIDEHKMHEEHYEIPEGFAEAYEKASRVIAVGTTTVRVLESAPHLQPHHGSTDIFIRPGHVFKRIDGLITNFHLPRSTLIMLVAAFAGYEFTLRAYEEAVRERYRFFSYGDAMLILP